MATALHIGTLEIFKGYGAGEQIELIPGTKIHIGRALENDLRIPDETVSRQHAEISVESDGVYFRNFGRNGSTVDGEFLLQAAPKRLRDGSIIHIESCEMRYEARQDMEGPLRGRIVVLQPDMVADPVKYATEEECVSKPRVSRQASRAKTQLFDPAPAGEEAETGNEIRRPMWALLLEQVASFRSRFLKTTISKVSFALFIFIIIMYISGSSENNSQEASAGGTLASFTDSGKAAGQQPEAARPAITGAAPESDQRVARAAFKSAEKLFSERMLRERNLFDSIQKWQAGLQLLQRYSRRPAAYDVASENLRTAKALLQRKFDAWQKEVIIHFKKKEYQEAHETLQRIQKAIPDMRDTRYRWAKDYDRKVQRML